MNTTFTRVLVVCVGLVIALSFYFLPRDEEIEIILPECDTAVVSDNPYTASPVMSDIQSRFGFMRGHFAKITTYPGTSGLVLVGLSSDGGATRAFVPVGSLFQRVAGVEVAWATIEGSTPAYTLTVMLEKDPFMTGIVSFVICVVGYAISRAMRYHAIHSP